MNFLLNKRNNYKSLIYLYFFSYIYKKTIIKKIEMCSNLSFFLLLIVKYNKFSIIDDSFSNSFLELNQLFLNNFSISKIF